jgi:hypothetical protein
MRFAADYSETLEVFLLTSVDLDVGSVGSTDNIQTIFELLACSVEHIGWNTDTGLQFIKSVNSCSEHNALDITPQEKCSGVMSGERGFSKPRVDFVDTLYISSASQCPPT